MKFDKMLAVAILLGTAINLFPNGISPIQAATIKTDQNYKTGRQVIKNSSLTKYGYILRLVTNSKDNTVYVGKSSYSRLLKKTTPIKAKTIDPKKIKNVKFRIDKVAEPPYKSPTGTELYLVASKDKKYSCWTTYSSLKYYYQNSKSMSGVIKPLKRIFNRIETVTPGNVNLNSSANKHDYNSAMKATKKLKGAQKTFVVNSLKQFKKDSSDGWIHVNNNILLFGIS